jgi:predicted nucleotidyltransferase
MPPEVARTVTEYRRLLQTRFRDRLLWMRLFGSRARGDADASSDTDVAVVIRDLTELERAEAIDLAFAAWRAVGPTAPTLSPLVWSDLELGDRLRLERRIAIDILDEGIAV